jgi:hypothetical protein
VQGEAEAGRLASLAERVEALARALADTDAKVPSLSPQPRPELRCAPARFVHAASRA